MPLLPLSGVVCGLLSRVTLLDNSRPFNPSGPMKSSSASTPSRLQRPSTIFRCDPQGGAHCRGANRPQGEAMGPPAAGGHIPHGSHVRGGTSPCHRPYRPGGCAVRALRTRWLHSVRTRSLGHRGRSQRTDRAGPLPNSLVGNQECLFAAAPHDPAWNGGTRAGGSTRPEFEVRLNGRIVFSPGSNRIPPRLMRSLSAKT